MTPPLLPPVLLHTATANGFQMVTSGAQSQAVSDWLITSVEVSSHLLSLPQGLCTGCTMISDVQSPLCHTREVVATKELDCRLRLWLSGQHLPAHRVLGSVPRITATRCANTHPEAEAERWGVQGYPWLHSLRLPLRYRSPCFHKKKRKPHFFSSVARVALSTL